MECNKKKGARINTMIDKKTGEPYINIWFGNFYRPAYDDREFVKESVRLLRRLGFNSVL